MPKKTIDEIRALVDPEGYLAGMRRVLDANKQDLSALLVQYDLAVDNEALNEPRRKQALAQLEAAMQSSLWRIEALEERIAGVKAAP